MTATTANGMHFDTTDLPRVRRDALHLAMRLLIEDGRGLVLMRGANAAERKGLEAAFWQSFEGETREGVATLVRLWSLIDVFQTRRLQTMLLEQGFAIVAKAITFAAEARLNFDRGFNPQHAVMALAERAEPVIAMRRQARPIAVSAEMALAA